MEMSQREVISRIAAKSVKDFMEWLSDEKNGYAPEQEPTKGTAEDKYPNNP